MLETSTTKSNILPDNTQSISFGCLEGLPMHASEKHQRERKNALKLRRIVQRLLRDSLFHLQSVAWKSLKNQMAHYSFV